MKSSNPDSGCREVDLSKTLDTTQPNPAKGQGGIGILQPIPVDMMNIRDRPSDATATKMRGKGYGEEGDPMFTLTKANHHAVVQPIAFSAIDDGRDATEGLSPTLRVGGNANGVMGVAFDTYNLQAGNISQTLQSRANNEAIGTVLAPALTTNNPSRSPQASEVTQQVNAVYQASMAVRRLTPTECERLQGFPDGYTNIKKNCPDGPRYKALGNSMAVPVMKWIGQRIADYEKNVGGK